MTQPTVSNAVNTIIGEISDYKNINKQSIIVIATRCMILVEKYYKNDGGTFKEKVVCAVIRKLIDDNVSDKNTRELLHDFNNLIVPTIIMRICTLSREGFKGGDENFCCC